jgi:hypothetical protein
MRRESRAVDNLALDSHGNIAYPQPRAGDPIHLPLHRVVPRSIASTNSFKYPTVISFSNRGLVFEHWEIDAGRTAIEMDYQEAFSVVCKRWIPPNQPIPVTFRVEATNATRTAKPDFPGCRRHPLSLGPATTQSLSPSTTNLPDIAERETRKGNRPPGRLKRRNEASDVMAERQM